MAFSAADAAIGFEFHDTVGPQTPFLLPGTGGTTHTRLNLTNMTSSLLVVCSDSSAPPYVIPKKTVATTAATTAGFPREGIDLYSDDEAAAKCLVPCQAVIPEGTPRYRVNFGTPTSEDVAAYTAATPSITLTTGLGADNDSNGALIIVYDGPGKGQWNIGTDYVQTSKVLTLAHPFLTALTTSSKVAIIEGEGGGVGGIGLWGRIDIEDADNIHVSDGYNDGNWLVCMSAEEISKHMLDGNLLVAPYFCFAE